MPKKKRTQQARSRRGGGVQGDVSTLSPGARAVLSLAGPFMGWYEQVGFSVDLGRAVIGEVGYMVSMIEADIGPCDPRRMDASQLHQLFDVVLPKQDGVDAEAMEALSSCMLTFIAFLDETGSWTGGALELEAARQATESALLSAGPVPAVADVLAQARATEVPAAEQLSALDDLPVVGQLRALLAWWGDSRTITGTGAMRLADVAAAARLLGTPVRTAQGGRRRQDDELDLGLSSAEGRLVRSMWEVPTLVELWLTAVDAGLLTVTSTSARRTSMVPLLTDGSVDDRLPLLQDVVARHLAVVLGTETPMRGLEQLTLPFVVAVLLASLAGQGLTPDQVEELRTRQLGVVPEALQPVLFGLVSEQLEKLRGLSVLSVGGSLDVPHALKPTVALALAILTSEPDDEVDDPDDDLDEIAEEIVTDVRSGASRQQSVYQIKISLKGASPPVWRRLLVASDTRLDMLHRLIQHCFSWEDYHLHRFCLGDPYRSDRVYEPTSQRGDDWPGGPAVVDERRRTLRDLAPHAGSQLTYLYDYGDDWVHTITVEKVLARKDAAAVPTCVGGRGLAPAEDSGGVYGWAHLVATASDPSDPDCEDTRDWLGLEQGEVLDLRSFDRAAVDTALSTFRD